MRKLSTKIAAFALAGLTAFAFAAGGCEETPAPVRARIRGRSCFRIS